MLDGTVTGRAEVNFDVLRGQNQRECLLFNSRVNFLVTTELFGEIAHSTLFKTNLHFTEGMLILFDFCLHLLMK